MGRRAIFAVAAATGAFALAGCGAATTHQDADGLRLSAPVLAAGPATVEVTDGRLGDATSVAPDGPLRELSPGGRLDVRPRPDATRRDGVGAGAACADRGIAPAAESLGSIAAATLCLLNGERADRGLAPLARDDKLSAAATTYAEDLVAGSYFSHTGRDGSDLLSRIRRSGYVRADAGWELGENLAWGTGGLGTPGSIMQAWMNSPGHRDNILNPAYREIGIGVVAGNPAHADGAGATYATEFGVIEGAEAVPAAKPKAAGKQARRHAAARRAKARRAEARKARKARAARNGGHRRSRAKRSGPNARISV
jgi:uncharacterized protein YkwD